MTGMRLPNFILMSSNFFLQVQLYIYNYTKYIFKINTTYFTTIEVHNNVRIKERYNKHWKKKLPLKKKNLKKREKKKPKPRDCCSEGDLIATVADRVGVAAVK